MSTKLKIIINEDGTLTAQVVATKPYGSNPERTVTITVDLEPDDIERLSGQLMPMLEKYCEEAKAQVSLVAQEALEWAEEDEVPEDDRLGFAGEVKLKPVDLTTHDVIRRGSHTVSLRKRA